MSNATVGRGTEVHSAPCNANITVCGRRNRGYLPLLRTTRTVTCAACLASPANSSDES